MENEVKQAIALGFAPRHAVHFTSREAEGQVYIPAVNWSMFLGSMGLFVTLLYLFIRFLPVISIFEMRTMLPTAEVREEPA